MFKKLGNTSTTDLFALFPVPLPRKGQRLTRVKRAIVNQIKSEPQSLGKMVYTFLSCALEQERRVFCLSAKNFFKLAEDVGLKLSLHHYGAFQKILEDNGFAVIHKFKKNQPSICVIEEETIVAELSHISTEAQFQECLDFVGYNKQTAEKPETKKEEPPTETPSSDSSDVNDFIYSQPIPPELASGPIPMEDFKKLIDDLNRQSPLFGGVQ